jgi:glycosyltransferase involved in cell wall biosynthesis
MTAPLATRAANVVQVPDLIWLTDIEAGRVPSVTDRLWRTIVPPIARRADRVAVFTEFGARDVESRLGVPRDRIDVVGCGFGMTQPEVVADAHAVRERLGLGTGPIILSIAAKKPHKNLIRLVDAMQAVRATVPDAVLVMPGPSGPYEDELRTRVRDAGLTDAVRLPGYVDDATIEELYATAACFAFPSLREGFGLPMLEAMRRGVAVVAADATCIPEVAGGAAELIDPLSEDAIARGIVRVLVDADRRAELIAAGRDRCTQFTWERCAQDILSSLERAWTAKQRGGA